MKDISKNFKLLLLGFVLCFSLKSFGEVGKTFTATLPNTKPGDPSGNFEIVISGLCGRGLGGFTDTKTGHYKYMVTGGDVSVNAESCNGSTTSWWRM